jgi:hypothetical protein
MHTLMQVGAGGIKLYKFVKAGTSGSWSQISSAAQPRFYDINEDNRGAHGGLQTLYSYACTLRFA